MPIFQDVISVLFGLCGNFIIPSLQLQELATLIKEILFIINFKINDRPVQFPSKFCFHNFPLIFRGTSDNN